MIKKEFVKLYAEMNEIDEKEALTEVEEFLETMKDAFKKYPKVVFRNFGVFEVRETKERIVCHSWKNNEIIHVKPRKYIKFRVSKNIEDMLFDK